MIKEMLVFGLRYFRKVFSFFFSRHNPYLPAICPFRHLVSICRIETVCLSIDNIDFAFIVEGLYFLDKITTLTVYVSLIDYIYKLPMRRHL